jgi:hypothetical protein
MRPRYRQPVNGSQLVEAGGVVYDSRSASRAPTAAHDVLPVRRRARLPSNRRPWTSTCKLTADGSIRNTSSCWPSCARRVRLDVRRRRSKRASGHRESIQASGNVGREARRELAGRPRGPVRIGTCREAWPGGLRGGPAVAWIANRPARWTAAVLRPCEFPRGPFVTPH